MNPIASVGPGGLGWGTPAPAATSSPGPAAGAGAAPSRDAQMADLGSTTQSVNALQSLAASTAPITIPQTQNVQPPTANTSNELVDAMSGGGDDPS